MRLQRESCVYIVYLCHEIVANYLRTSLQLSHSSEIGALGLVVSEKKIFYVFPMIEYDHTFNPNILIGH